MLQLRLYNMSGLVHKGPVCLQVFNSTKRGVFHRLRYGVCLVRMKACSHNGPCQIKLDMLDLKDDLINNMDKKATWDRFYTENSRKGNFKNFEWFFGFHSVKDCILPLLQSMSDTPAPLHVLDIGCGTSALGPGIYTHSQYAVKVMCADISPVAVRLMQEYAESTPVQPCNPASTLTFREMDCTELEGHFEPKSLALIVDKGTTDALIRSKEGQAKAGQIVRQCLTVLRHSGSLLQFSDEDPDARLLWLENESQSSEVASNVSVHEVGQLRGVTYFCYQITPYTSLYSLH